MGWLLDLIPGGGLTATLVGIVAALGALLGLFKTVQRTGHDKRRAEEAEARAKNLDDVRRAQDAAAGVRPATPEQLHNDPHNRDNRR